MSDPTGRAIAAAFGKSIGAKFEALRAENAKLREQRDRLVSVLSDLTGDLELRASISDEPDTVDVSDGIYMRAKNILAEIEGEKK